VSKCPLKLTSSASKLHAASRLRKRFQEILSRVEKAKSRRELPRVFDFAVAQSGIRAGEIESIVIWSEVLRDARNAIHFGVKPVIPNTYEKVAVLLLAAADNLSKLYHIKRVAEQLQH